jgi:hypothetical protein
MDERLVPQSHHQLQGKRERTLIDQKEKQRPLHSASRSLNSFNVKLKQSVTSPNDALQKWENSWIPFKVQLATSIMPRTCRKVVPETVNVK